MSGKSSLGRGGPDYCDGLQADGAALPRVKTPLNLSPECTPSFESAG